MLVETLFLVLLLKERLIMRKTGLLRQAEFATQAGSLRAEASNLRSQQRPANDCRPAASSKCFSLESLLI
jgi:hypothetical protein